MAANHIRHRSSARMQIVRALQPRESPNVPTGVTGVAFDAVPSPSPSVTQVAKPLPTSVKALAGFIVVLGVVILAIAAWKIGVWRRRKIRAASQMVGSYRPEKTPFHLSLENRSTDTKVIYVAPLPLLRPEPAHSPNKAVSKGTNRFLGKMSFSHKFSNPTDVLSPPPTYAVSDLTIPSTPPPVPPKANLQIDVSTTQSATNLTIDLLKTGAVAGSSPIASPRRTSSYDPDSPMYKAPGTARSRSKSLSGKKLPRLMVVGCTFVPSLADELSIKVGETLRLLEEYEDEWCMVQHIGKSDAEKGVVPRFCLQERSEATGVMPRHKGMSSLASAFAMTARP